MKLTAAIIIACLLTACGSGGCDWLEAPEKPTKVAD